MNQPTPTVSTRISHAFSQKRGWTARTSVSVTAPMVTTDDGTWALSPTYDAFIEERLQMADRMARDESVRRNIADGWTPPQENQ